MSSDCASPVSQKEAPKEKASKQAQVSKVAEQAQSARIAMAQQEVEMARRKMVQAQYDMALATQRMQWQHSALAYQYQANQAAQLRAAQCAWW